MVGSYEDLVYRLTSSPGGVRFRGEITSTALTETLAYIRLLEKEGRLAVTGDTLPDHEFNNILYR